jgi:hypothetical protein
MDSQDWMNDPSSHVDFEADLSCLLDGELDELRSARAMLHLEECSSCREFFQDLRLQVALHRDIADPTRLMARVAMQTAGTALPTSGWFDELENEAETRDLVHRLATVFYQLGKAYVLAAVDPGYRTRVFEAAVSVGASRHQGRGFIDGVVASGRAGGEVDWDRARHMLNGRLERIEDPLEKGRRLLDEALLAEPEHEEARLYRAFLMGHEGRRLQAAGEYRSVFREAMDEANRGHAAMQLGKLFVRERSYRKALACFRWVSLSGLADRDDRFFGARFNLFKCHAMLAQEAATPALRERQRERALAAFAALHERHPAQLDTVRRLLLDSPLLRQAIDSVPGFPEALLERFPDLFGSDPSASTTAGS